MSQNQKKSGFSLLESMVAVAMLAGLSLVAMNLSKQSTKSSTKFQYDSEVTQILNEITGILSSPTKCLATFGSKNALSDTTITSINGNQYYVSSHASAPANDYTSSDCKQIL